MLVVDCFFNYELYSYESMLVVLNKFLFSGIEYLKKNKMVDSGQITFGEEKIVQEEILTATCDQNFRSKKRLIKAGSHEKKKERMENFKVFIAFVSS